VNVALRTTHHHQPPQVQVILDVLGTPASPEALGFAPREDAATFMARQKKRIPVPWNKVFPANTSQPALDLVAALLNWVRNLVLYARGRSLSGYFPLFIFTFPSSPSTI